MNVFDCITTRRSIRKFEKKEVDDRLIGVMLYMATHAPSCGNLQDWNFLIVKDEGVKEKLFEAALQQPFIKEAPVLIVACADLEKASMKYGKRGEVLYSIQDTASAITILLLTANVLGLGTTWVGAFDEERVKDILQLPERLRPIALIPVGYAAEKPEMPKRLPFENLTWIERVGKKYDISYYFQPGPREVAAQKPIGKPIGNRIEDALKKYRKEVKEKKKPTFAEMLKKVFG
jgi:nitroreductase